MGQRAGFLKAGRVGFSKGKGAGVAVLRDEPAGEVASSAAARQESTLRRNLRCSTYDGIAYSVMVGTGENFFPAYVLALGMGEVSAGLVATLPLVIGAAFQLFSATGVQLVGSYKRWVVLMAGMQALSLLPLVLTAGFHVGPGWLVFVMASVYWFSFLAGGAAWNTWIGKLVPDRVRPRYFGRRNRILQIAVMAALLAGGFILRGTDQIRAWAGEFAWPAWVSESTGVRAFAILFGIACIARIISTYYLSRQSSDAEVTTAQFSTTVVRPREMLSRMIHGKDGRLILYLVAMSVAAHMAQPFFNPFMLKKLGLSSEPEMYSLMLAAPLLGRAMALRWWGELAEERGARVLLVIGGVGLIPFSVNWLISDNFAFLFITQLASGAVWAAYELGLFLMLLETTKEDERTSVVSQYQFVNSLAMVTGNGIGALVLWKMDASWGGYAVVFGMSLVARLLTVPLLMRTRGGSGHAPHMEMETLGVRPSGGSVDAPVVASMEKKQ
jgi:MFS family permease